MQRREAENTASAPDDARRGLAREPSAARMMMREGALPEWTETPSAPRALARSTRPAGARPPGSRHTVLVH
jgi:hypothetical protein